MQKFSKLKVCFLAGTLEHGGAERQLYYILQALCQAGMVPRVLSLDQGGFWEKKIQELGVSVKCIEGRRSRLFRLWRILREIHNEPPDILQSQHFFMNPYTGVAARLTRAGGIGAMRSNGYSEAEKSGFVGGWLGLHCPGIIAANSRSAAQYAVAHGIPAARVYFLPNAVDTDWFQPPEELPGEPFTLVTVGRLVEEKRLDRFISIISRLRTHYRINVRGVIVGPDGQNLELKPHLENQARRLGLLPDNLQFRGGIADTRAVYHEASACILTSDYEGTPNVLLEAMACGLPVVASHVGGVPEIVQHGQTGFLFEPNNLEAFAATLVELLKNSGLRAAMGRRARAYVEENHSLHRLPKYLEGLYALAFPAPRHAAAGMAQSATV